MKYAATAAAGAFALAGPGYAAPDFTDTAQVIAATPIMERVVEQRQECTPVAAAPAPQRERSLVGPIVGGVAGAAVGSQVGRGSGRTAATAAGAIAGTIIGDRVGNPDTQTATAQPTQYCRIVESTRDVVRAYSVIYRYNGHDVTTTLPYHPGSTVRVAVGIADGPQVGSAPPPPPPGVTTVREVSTTPPPPPPPGAYRYPDGTQYRY